MGGFAVLEYLSSISLRLPCPHCRGAAGGHESDPSHQQTYPHGPHAVMAAILQVGDRGRGREGASPELRGTEATMAYVTNHQLCHGPGRRLMRTCWLCLVPFGWSFGPDSRREQMPSSFPMAILGGLNYCI